MQYRALGNTGVEVSVVCLGTMMFGGQTDESTSIQIMHRAFDEGINFVDTANMYNAGESEVVVGKALAGRRDDVVLATKGRHPVEDGLNRKGGSRLNMMRSLEASLKRMGVDDVDLGAARQSGPRAEGVIRRAA